MKKKYSNITDISYLNSNTKTKEDFFELYQRGFFENDNLWSRYKLENTIEGVKGSINSRLKNRMSKLSLGVYNVLESGPGNSISDSEEIYLFSGFGEIDATNSIIKNIIIDKLPHVSPTLFHNSVHHTPLGYYCILKKKNNPCIAVSDGFCTDISFCHFLSDRTKIQDEFIIVYGDEYSSFFELELENRLDIKPVFASYKIINNTDNGFCLSETYTSLDKLLMSDVFIQSDTVISDKESFYKIKKNTYKKVLCEYPIIMDNPCGLIFRISFPFYFNIKGRSIVIHNDNDKYYCFEVVR